VSKVNHSVEWAAFTGQLTLLRYYKRNGASRTVKYGRATTLSLLPVATFAEKVGGWWVKIRGGMMGEAAREITGMDARAKGEERSGRSS
jgi:hypothetical protein